MQELGAGRAVDGTIHAAAAQQRRVRRIDDGIDLHLRDVAANGAKRFLHDPFRCC